MKWGFAIVAIIWILLFSGCLDQNDQKDGFLSGKVSIGPLCPVERNPPDPSCQPTEETYKAWPIAVYSSDKKVVVSRLQPGPNGTYRVELSSGNYVVDLVKSQNGVGRSNLPMRVIITPGESDVLDIDIDTGIR